MPVENANVILKIQIQTIKLKYKIEDGYFDLNLKQGSYNPDNI